MRDVLTLSVPTDLKKSIKKKSLERGFNSVSDYVKYLIKEDNDLIPATDLLKDAREAKKEYKAGKTIKAKSLVDLYKK